MLSPMHRVLELVVSLGACMEHSRRSRLATEQAPFATSVTIVAGCYDFRGEYASWDAGDP
jgi:hypothetical protein